MGLLRKIRNWRSAENPAKITLIRVYLFLKAMFRKAFKSKLPKHYAEQIQWRKTKINPECKNQGFCKFCGCDTDGIIYLDEACEGKCYPDMMGKDEWKQFKKTNNICLN